MFCVICKYLSTDNNARTDFMVKNQIFLLFLICKNSKEYWNWPMVLYNLTTSGGTSLREDNYYLPIYFELSFASNIFHLMNPVQCCSLNT